MLTVKSYIIINNSSARIDAMGVSGKIILEPGQQAEFSDPDALWLLRTYGFLSAKVIEKEIKREEEVNEEIDEEKLDEGSSDKKISDETDYSGFTKEELKEKLDQAGVKYKTTAKKAGLIRLLKKSEKR